ncbi:MAG TPA: hypothetical protein VH913_14385 [Hyphomicrobiaceae bacterium]
MRTMLMREIFRIFGPMIAALALLHTLGAPAGAQVATKQMKLAEKQIVSFIAAQKKMASARAETEAEAIAKEHGFASLDEIDDVEANIVLAMGSIDPQTHAFVEPPVLIKRRIDEVTADKSISEEERKNLLQELNESLKTAQPIQFPENVELVKKYYDKLQAALE